MNSSSTAAQLGSAQPVSLQCGASHLSQLEATRFPLAHSLGLAFSLWMAALPSGTPVAPLGWSSTFLILKQNIF